MMCTILTIIVKNKFHWIFINQIKEKTDVHIICKECDLLKMTKMLIRTLLFSIREMVPYVKEIDGKFQAFSLYLVV